MRAEADISPYVHELRGLYPGRSPLVLRPGSVEEVSRILKLATETRTPIVPQGGNTGLVGGQVPHASGNEIVVSLSRLNRVREIDTLSNTVTAEAGVVLEALHRAVDAADRMFPLSLASQGSCEIGGNLSSNAGGTAVLAYGNTRELCLGVEVVLPTGEVFDDLRKLKKDNTGYDLKNLFVGAEGTLGIITAAVLKIFPKPRGREVGWAGVSIAGGGACAVRAGDRACRQQPHRLRADRQDAALFLAEVLAGRRAAARRRLALACADRDFLGPLAGGRARTDRDDPFGRHRERSRRRRRDRRKHRPGQRLLGAARKHLGCTEAGRRVDQARHLDSDRVGAGIHRPRRTSRSRRSAPGARVVCFGHMGDGNLHYNISQPVGADPKAFLALYRPMNKAVHDIVRDLDGSISAEHGIGQLKRDELLATAPPVGIDLMRRVKAAFDPAGIMNPGKVL